MTNSGAAVIKSLPSRDLDAVIQSAASAASAEVWMWQARWQAVLCCCVPVLCLYQSPWQCLYQSPCRKQRLLICFCDILRFTGRWEGCITGPLDHGLKISSRQAALASDLIAAAFKSFGAAREMDVKAVVNLAASAASPRRLC